MKWSWTEDFLRPGKRRLTVADLCELVTLTIVGLVSFIASCLTYRNFDPLKFLDFVVWQKKPLSHYKHQCKTN